jgi:gliding motility-associated-like protein
MKLLLVLSALISSLAIPLSASDEVVVWDTAYVDVQGYIDNRSDSVKSSGRSFIGPGPVTVHFEAEAPDIMTYFVWQIANDNSFSDVSAQFYEYDIDYTFNETGTYYARFMTANADNTEETTSEVYTIQITESELLIPNVITPNSPSGANQVFKVKYKSLKSFEMWVFNRWGNKLFHTTDPSEGWDGTYNGRMVPTGAYYYLIKAEGTDGIHYNKKGDINVLMTREHSNSSSSTE